MNKYKFFIISIFVFLFILPISVYSLNDKNLLADFDAQPYQDMINTNYEYSINKYKVDIKVNENNTFNIKEYITAYFNVPKHGIYRKIPLKNNIVRLDGTKSYNNARVKDINVDEEYKDYNQQGYRVIQIGDPYLTITGSKDYVIEYLYNIGKDKSKEYDEFYFNIIGNEWDTTINGVEFVITMPKDFDEKKLGFSSGSLGSTDSSNIEYSVDGKVISGKYNGTLMEGDGLTVRLELPDGYFVGAGNDLSLMSIIFFALPITFAIISFLLWYKYGKDEKPIETVEFYPPERFNSAEVGFLYKGRAESKDVISLLIYLANKGYIRIEETQEKALFSSKTGFKIVKVKDYDGNNINEKAFLDGLFKSKSVQGVILFEEVTETDLYNSFYITLNSIIKNLNGKENKHKIFEKITSSKSIAVILMIIISLFTIIAIPTFEYAGFSSLGVTLGITLFYIPFYAVGLSKSMPSPFKIIWLGFTIFHSSIFFMVSPLREALFSDPTYLAGFLLGLVSITIMILCFKVMPKRTPYGNEILGKIKGFKTFLETVEKLKLEELVMQDPKYFYNILPFTYVLGVSDKWINKFESIALQAPDWYGGYSTFSMASFGSFMTSTMASANKSMSSSPSSDGGGFGGSSSGGGSSGGGSGGGGGGSW